MQAAVLRQPGTASATGPLELEERPDPKPGPGELLLEVHACAVCRTDLQLAEGDIELRRGPVIPGHQAVGRVLGFGPGVSGWDEGDWAGVGWLGGSCETCSYCTSGRENLCEAAEFTGWDRDGGFAGRMTVRAPFAVPLPSREPTELAPLLCGGVIGYRSLKLSGIQPGGRLGLYGFGASARLAIQVARYWGCEVYVATRSAAEQQNAREMGAAWAGTYDDSPPVPLDAAVTFAPAGRVVIAALRALAPGGTVAVNAIHLDEVPAFDYSLLWRERSLRSVANFTRADAREFMALAGEIPVQAAVQTFSLAEVNSTLAAIRDGTLAATAVLDLRRDGMPPR